MRVVSGLRTTIAQRSLSPTWHQWPFLQAVGPARIRRIDFEDLGPRLVSVAGNDGRSLSDHDELNVSCSDGLVPTERIALLAGLDHQVVDAFCFGQSHVE